MPEAEEIEFEWGGATKPRMFDSSRWCCAPETNQVKINFTINNIEKATNKRLHLYIEF